MVEREAAVELLEGGRGGVRFGRRKGVVEGRERERMRYWSWFVAVWGKRPEGALVAKSKGADAVEEKEGESAETVAKEEEKKSDGEDPEADEDTEQWWGFWEPEEVAKLAEWLAMRHGINLEKKRAPKGSEETAVLGVAEAQKGNNPSKARGRPSNASSARASFIVVSDSEDDSEDEREQDRNRDEGDDDIDDDGDVLMRVDEHGEPVPTKRDLRKLARCLKEYSEMLAWRIKRASKDDKGKDTEKNADTQAEEKDNDNGDGKRKGKGKAVESRSPPAEGIAPATFYGKK
uniref:N/A n=1 Tax=Ganoderma boninense TaxID=34458 RepID=A0A5K1K2P5_9APHY|nr:N/A [Ganoderma boninense]